MRSPSSIWFTLLGLAMFAFASAQESRAPATSPRPGAGVAKVLKIEGPIGPATSRFVEKGLEMAQAGNSRLVILEIDTPGGLDTSMRDMIRAILASKIPVVSYVSPSGARAASAGTYILYASHIAAMAPATNLGAATPVSIGGQPPAQPSREPERPGGGEPEDKGKPEPATPPSDSAQPSAGSPSDAKGSSGADRPSGTDKNSGAGEQPARKPADSEPPADRDEPATAMERKVVNDAVAYIRGLAELRGRNADWAEQAVRRGVSLSASEALEKKVIDLIARDLQDLLAQIDGREVRFGQKTVTIDTTGIVVERVEPDWRTKLLSTLTNPTIAYGLLLIGIYGLLLEGYNPGAIVPGVVGAISLLLALFAFQILSVNYAGLALVGLGIVMIIAEFFVPSFGALGLGGLTAFVVGSIILLDTDVPGLDIATPVIAGVATGGGLVAAGIAYVASRSMRRPVAVGAQTMVGETAEVVESFDKRGMVRVGGELWNAHTSVPLKKGQQVRILKVQGLSVWVEPLQ